MIPREIAFVVDPVPAPEAKGVRIMRSVGSERLSVLDPIMLFDHLTLEPVPHVGRVGFPRHPHRGIETLTYVFAGQMHHKDSIGNESSVAADEVQWMTAGKGIWHEEMLEAGTDGVEAIQLWFSLPRDQKRVPPAYRSISMESIPVVEDGGCVVRVIAGTFANARGPASEISARPTVLQIDLELGESLTVPTAPGSVTVCYAVREGFRVADRSVETARMAVFTDGDHVVLHQEGTGDARLYLVSVMPLQEPILQYRSFVMNVPEDIREIERDIASGEFGRP
jgi:redox-sensitive bicupin YhaK (pirin superfamily)